MDEKHSMVEVRSSEWHYALSIRIVGRPLVAQGADWFVDGHNLARMLRAGLLGLASSGTTAA